MSQTKAQILNPLNGNLNITGVVTASSFVGNVTGTASTSTAAGTAYALEGSPNLNVGVVTASSFVGDVTGNADTATNAQGLTGTPSIIVNNVVAAAATFTGNVSIAGTLTYEDVTNVDSIGLVTARNGIQVLAGGIDAVGVITATSFIGDGSGLTGAGSTVADDTSTNATFYPLFTQTTSGTVTDSKVSTTKLTFNPSSGTVTATTFSGALSGNSTTASTLQTSRTINGTSFNGSSNIVVNPTSGAYSNGQGAKTIQSGGSASGGSSGDIYYIY